MPELPDVEIYRHRLDAHALHKRIERVDVKASGLLQGTSAAELRRLLTGHNLASTRRHGKHLFVEIGGERRWLRLHFGMTGELRYYEGGDPPDHVRLRLDFDDDRHLIYRNVRKLGRIGVADSPEEYARAAGLGPDALDVSPAVLRALLEGRSGTVKGLLMNQGLIAGLGNVYVDEILYQAGVHPETPARAIDGRTAKSLHRIMGRVIATAIAREADPSRVPRQWLLPHRRAGADCPRCPGTIRSKRIAGRTSYYCDEHQRPPAAGGGC